MLLRSVHCFEEAARPTHLDFEAQLEDQHQPCHHWDSGRRVWGGAGSRAAGAAEWRLVAAAAATAKQVHFNLLDLHSVEQSLLP